MALDSVKMSREDYDLLLAMRLNLRYLPVEVEMMQRIVKDNIDPWVKVCSGCSGSETDLKNKLYNWFMGNQERILDLIEQNDAKQMQNVDKMMQAEQETEKYIQNGKETDS